MVDALDSGSSGSNAIGVQVPGSALPKMGYRGYCQVVRLHLHFLEGQLLFDLAKLDAGKGQVAFLSIQNQIEKQTRDVLD
jgi:hypothetical protein